MLGSMGAEERAQEAVRGEFQPQAWQRSESMPRVALAVDGFEIAALDAPEQARLPPSVAVNVATGYERDAAAWAHLPGRAEVAALDPAGAGRLDAYAADLARPRDGRPHGKAAARGGAGS